MYAVYMEVIFYPSKRILGFEGRSKYGNIAYNDCISKIRLYSEEIKETFEITMLLKSQIIERKRDLEWEMYWYHLFYFQFY